MATLSIKVVPGAKKNRIVGKYGDAIKLQVSAPPEGGKANEAVIALLAEALGIGPRQISITRGHTQPRKTVEIDGLDQATAEARLLSNAG
ncbi:MAG TPA: DUF167 domain-containing protein [Tepidisphaeraceae bacterium]|jgi:uncharacterized protein (TIGR00251 family)